MQANEFEKQVKDQLDEFQLNPSASVWKNVEEQIRRKKKRRVIIFFILPLCIAFGGVTVWLASFENEYRQVAGKNEQSPGNTIHKINTNDVPATMKGHDQQVVPSETAAHTSLQANPDKPLQTLATTSTNNKLSIKTTGAGINSKQMTSNESKLVPEKMDNNESDQTATDLLTDNADLTKEEISKTAEQNLNPSSSLPPIPGLEKPGIVDTASVNKEMKVEILVEKEEAKDEEISDAGMKLGKKARIRWGIDGSIGATSSRRDIFTFPVIGPMQDAYTNYPGTGSGGPSTVPRPPSPVKPGMAFSIGLVGESDLNSRISVHAGLQYAYMSTTIRNGAKKDTVVDFSNGVNQDVITADGIYSATPDRNFVNRFHFIEVPVGASWRIHRKLPVYINLGASAGYLFKSNALIYSPTLGGMYYHDMNAFNRLHLNLSGGISVKLNLRNGGMIGFGPSLRMDMTPILDKPVEQKKYLLFSGISLRYLWGKK